METNQFMKFFIWSFIISACCNVFVSILLYVKVLNLDLFLDLSPSFSPFQCLCCKGKEIFIISLQNIFLEVVLYSVAILSSNENKSSTLERYRITSTLSSHSREFLMLSDNTNGTH